MHSVAVHVKALGRSAAEIYPILSDFQRYPEHSEAVRSVAITDLGEQRVLSSWEVNFQRGILRWKEEDLFRPDAFTIEFNQVEGDIDYFVGQWTLRDEEDGCAISFTADFDLGIPTLKDLLEPIAEQALRDNIRSIIAGLLAGQATLTTV